MLESVRGQPVILSGEKPVMDETKEAKKGDETSQNSSYSARTEHICANEPFNHDDAVTPFVKQEIPSVLTSTVAPAGNIAMRFRRSSFRLSKFAKVIIILRHRYLTGRKR